MLKYSKSLFHLTQKFAKDHPDVIDFIRDKQFRVADTSLTYRQINSLDENMVLNSSRDSKKGWRKFSLKDLVYLELILEARSYGVVNKNLKELKDQFYSIQKEDKVDDRNLYIAEYSILSALFGERTSWILYKSGKSLFADADGFLAINGIIDKNEPSYLHVDMSSIVNRVLKNNPDKLETLDPPSLISIIFDRIGENLSEKEAEILGIIRNENYSKVTIVKKGKNNIVYGEAVKDSKKISEKEMLSYFSKRNFSNIQVQKRNGEIVSYRVEDVFKI